MMNREIIKNRKQTDIELVMWLANKPQAVLVLAHGASEHIYRYSHFAEFLKDNNISVYGYNHLGHGCDRKMNDVFFDDKCGDEILISDLEDVCLHVYQQNKDIPIILMGHSMGSIITRALSIETKLLFDGIIICGSLHPKQSLVKGGKTLASVMTKVTGAKNSSKMLNKIAFGELEKTLSINKENITTYINDNDCGMMFTNSAIHDLMKLLDKIVDPNNISKMLKTNYYIISGAMDPFSDKCNDLYVFLQLLNNNKVKYSYKFYQGMMHEILNEDDNEIVYQDILVFIKKRIENKFI